MTELKVDEYGLLRGGEKEFPLGVTSHNWETPYPIFDSRPSFEWEAGTAGARPNVFRHHEIRDWVCDTVAYSALIEAASPDIRLLGKGTLEAKEMYIVQAVTMLDVVDLESSVVKDYGSYRVVEFPALHRSFEKVFRSRVFRVPGSYTEVFVGEDVQRALDAAGVSGMDFIPLPIVD